MNRDIFGVYISVSEGESLDGIFNKSPYNA